MEFRQLKSFVKTAETLNFSEAAKILSITQSTLSQQIKQLEDEMNILLFQRNSHSVILTEAGKELYSLAKKTLHSVDSCFERMQDLQKLLVGTLNVGATYTFSPMLEEILINFAKLYPKVKLHIYYKPMEELMEMLKRHEIDFVLAFKSVKQYPEVESRVLFNNHLAAIVNKHHSLANKKTVSLSEIEKYDVVLPSQGLQARNLFEQIKSRYCLHLNIRMELNEVYVLLNLVKKSQWVTFLSESTVYSEDYLRAIPLDVSENEMEGCIHLLKDEYFKHSAQEFIRLLSESIQVKRHMLNGLF